MGLSKMFKNEGSAVFKMEIDKDDIPQHSEHGIEYDKRQYLENKKKMQECIQDFYNEIG